MRKEGSPEKVVREIRRRTRRRFSAEEKIRIGSRGCGARKASPPCAGERAWRRPVMDRWVFLIMVGGSILAAQLSAVGQQRAKVSSRSYLT